MRIVTIAFFIFIAGGMIAGCENANEPNRYELVIDSTVSSKLAEHRALVIHQNDSILKALEIARADSLARCAQNKKAPAVAATDTAHKK